MTKLEVLHGWCRGAGKPLVLEVLVARRHEAEDEFEASGRPAMLAGFITEAYRRGLTPEFWKIEGTLSPQGARTIDAAIAAHPAGRQIILGKAADLSTIDRWFAACAASTTASGFAIGRSVFLGAVSGVSRRTNDRGRSGGGHRGHVPRAGRCVATITGQRARNLELGTQNSELVSEF